LQKSGLRAWWLLFSQATTVALAAWFVVGTLKPHWLHSAAPVLLQQVPAPAASSPARVGYAQAARLATPAVVSITASKPPARSARGEAPWHPFPLNRRGEGRPQVGLGSGVIVTSEGYLLTNNHVVAGASDIEVLLSDGREARAELVGTDPETDLAVLRIRLPGLPVIRLGRAETLQVGDVVLAIGNPFNVGQTVTSGIVSALGRSQLGINTFENFIQTDAAINPGNSGGALVDAEGQLVGINTAIFSRSGGSLGIGFAIPISTASQVLEALVKDGQVARGWIGVQTRELTPEMVDAFKLSTKQGVLVSGVVGKSPAAAAGVKPGDVVTGVAGKPVLSPAELLSAAAALKPGSQVLLAVQRGSESLELKLLVGQRPKPQIQADEAPE